MPGAGIRVTVRLRVDGDDVERDVLVRWEPGATVGDLRDTLATALGEAAIGAGAVRLAGRRLPAATALAATGLLAGDLIEAAPTAVTDPWPEAEGRPVATLAIEGCLDAGTIQLRPGVHRVGTHLFAVDQGGLVHATELGAAAVGIEIGAWAPLVPGKAVRLAGRRVTVGGVSTDPVEGGRLPAGAAGTRPFHRGPRRLPSPVEPVAVPVLPAEEERDAPGMAVALAGPMLSAGAMVAVTGEPRYALVGLAGPALVGAAALVRRRAKRRRAGVRERAVDELLDVLGSDLARAGLEEVRRLEVLAPGPPAVVERAVGATAGLWERAPRHGAADGFLHLRLGLGDLRWEPPLVGGPEPGPLAAAVATASVLRDAPVVVDLRSGEAGRRGVVGIAGPRPAALAVARWLVVQAATLHGPADLAFSVAAPDAAGGDWAWIDWLPHAGTGPVAGNPVRLAVLDPCSIDPGPVPAGPAVVLAPTVDELPAVCDAVVRLRADGAAVLERPRAAVAPVTLAAEGIDATTAGVCARALARLSDPDLHAGHELAQQVDLLDLLQLGPAPSPAAIADRWRREGGRCRVPIGLGPGGAPVVLDLVADGPHALVGGTTGAGKSELLRTLVAGLAASAGPDEVTFVLVDFKGGSAFDACAGLPHTVGLVTDLDPLMAERALTSLDAELRRRELVLRAAGAADLLAYRAAGSTDGPVPRLVVVVDEFATLRAELPGFVDALVGIAQRGRSLGIHLVLATQRPAGVVSEDIRANTAIRVALRTQSAGDSDDVVGSDAAAAISRDAPGRGYLRLGPGDLLEIQTARCSGPVVDPTRPLVEVLPLTGRRAGRPVDPPTEPPSPPGPSALDVLTAAARAAFAAGGHAPPRRPWLPPLPTTVPLASLAPIGPPAPGAVLADAVVLGVADDPQQQRQLAAAWCPGGGHLLVVGALGSGTTTTLASVAVAAAWDAAPDRCHLHVVDGGAGQLGPLGQLPHCAGVIGAGEPDRLARLVRQLASELAGRASGAGGRPAIVLVVDGYAAMEASLRDAAGDELVDLLRHVLARGTEVGVHAVLGTDRMGGVPPAVAAPIAQRLVLPLAHPTEFAVAGVDGRRLGGAPPGRGILAATGLLVQVGQPAPSLDSAVAAVAARHRPPAVRPAPIEVLASRIPLAELLVSPRPVSRERSTDDPQWLLPVGRRERDLGIAGLAIGPGEQVLVVGGARTGKTSALGTVAAAARATRPGAALVVLAGTRSPLAAAVGAPAFGPQDVAKLAIHLDEVAGAGDGVLLLVDDADDVPDADGLLEGIASGAHPGVVTVAAARPDGVRSGYGHWTRSLRRHRLGVLLQPGELDGELLGVALPRRPVAVMVPGRGYLVRGGEVELVQIADASDHRRPCRYERPGHRDQAQW